MLAIIDYGAGNIGSVQRACAETGIQSFITANPGDLKNAERIIFPGVGAAPATMQNLTRTGLATALKEAYATGIPILGICLGAQVVLDRSEEGDTPCLESSPALPCALNFRTNRSKFRTSAGIRSKQLSRTPYLKALKMMTNSILSILIIRSRQTKKTCLRCRITAASFAARLAKIIISPSSSTPRKAAVSVCRCCSVLPNGTAR